MYRKPKLLIAAALFVCMLLATGCGAREASLTVLYTNDVHGFLLPHGEYSEPDAAELGASKDVGGAARRATYIKAVGKYTKGP
ncbi:MAG: hypothetical protein ILO36_04065, partial [Abditibacteriota bacterium]|nr:hypothetical protein [Abditibacteriota bacterium]